MVIMIMAMSAIVVLILSVLVVVEAQDHDPLHLSPNPPKISNSMDEFKLRNIIPSTVIKDGEKILQNVKEVIGLGSSKKKEVELGKNSISSYVPPPKEIKGSAISSEITTAHDSKNGKSELSNDTNRVSVTYGTYTVAGNNLQPMEDEVVAEVRKIGSYEIGLFAIFDGYESHSFPHYLHTHLFNIVVTHPAFLLDTETAVREGYLINDARIMEKSSEYGFSGKSSSTVVTAILTKGNGQSSKLVVANVGDSRAVICCKDGVAKQLSIDHNPTNKTERKRIKKRGGFIAKVPAGYVPRVNGIVPLTRAFGIKFMKKYISCEPDVVVVEITDDEIEFLVLASHPLWNYGC